MLRRRLSALARNLWWTWDSEATALWSRIDGPLFEAVNHDAVALLDQLTDPHWAELEADDTFVAEVEALHERFRADVGRDRWADEAGLGLDGGVAYLSMEFGLHESLRLYSGGLGVLAGDHLRSAHDLGLPLVGVSLLYREGYFQQQIVGYDQTPSWVEAHWPHTPVRPLTDDDGEPLAIEVPMTVGAAVAHLHALQVGRVQLVLLDTDHDANPPAIRELTHRLYAGDHNTRIRQEILLGIGGIRALRALGRTPCVVHLNEGHCAFAALELASEAMADGAASFAEAREAARRQCVFTTHTPVPAGHDRFAVEHALSELAPWATETELDLVEVVDAGRERGGPDAPLNMTVLALRHSARSNGVSRLHGAVSRAMWAAEYPGVAQDAVPIGHITNGVHPVFWSHPRSRALFDAHAPGWRERPWDEAVWAPLAELDDATLWTWRTANRADLLALVARRTGRQLDPEALTIGFARRFATYKRGALLFTDPDRLDRILNGDRPVNLLFAGKAHPADRGGQAIVSEVLRHADDPRFRDRVAFLPDYDMVIGRALTSGSDVWLNNPRRPKEASGTSGQKVPLNGGINLSVLDGWWDEGFDGTNGWAIGDRAVRSVEAEQDAADAASLYTVLEGSVLPEWSDRDARDRPTRWIERMRRSLVTCAPRFTSTRMVRDYALELYAPVAAADRG